LSAAGSRWDGVSLAVLCGGAEDGAPSVDSAWLGTLFEDLLWVGLDAEPPFPGRRVADPPGAACPLRGLVGALEAAREERVLLLAGRHGAPLPDVVFALLAAPDADAIVPLTDGGAEPLCALYRREPVLARARARLTGGSLDLQALLDDLDVWPLEGAALLSLRSAGRGSEEETACA